MGPTGIVTHAVGVQRTQCGQRGRGFRPFRWHFLALRYGAALDEFLSSVVPLWVGVPVGEEWATGARSLCMQGRQSPPGGFQPSGPCREPQKTTEAPKPLHNVLGLSPAPDLSPGLVPLSVPHANPDLSPQPISGTSGPAPHPTPRTPQHPPCISHTAPWYP